MEPLTPRCAVATEATSGAYYCTRPAGHSGPCAAVPVPLDPEPPQVPAYVHLLVEARHLDDDFVTIPRSLYVDLLQRVCSPLAPRVDQPYPPHNPPSAPVDPNAPAPVHPFAASLKKFL